ncbi:geranylgeranylglyceryl/heptaprenylglyceryl phosphate synthase [Candidatus Altiarchaeota archaeon]
MKNIIEEWRSKGRLHFTLIDPDKQAPEEAAALSVKSGEYGTDAIMVGGSTAEGNIVDETVKAVKKESSLPTILFPSTARGVSPNADHIFWMMLMNSKDRRFLVGEQAKAAIPFSKTSINPIPMGYIVVSTSSKPTKVEEVGDVDVIGEGDVEKALSYALAAQYFGMHCVYLEAGSGADKPVPSLMIRKIKDSLSVPVIVGGGIRSAEQAKEALASGADAIVSGTVCEKEPERLADIINAVKTD